MIQILTILNIILTTSAIWILIVFYFLSREREETTKILKEKNSIIKSQDTLINTQEEKIDLLQENSNLVNSNLVNSNLVNTRLRQCREIMEQQHGSITYCYKFLMAFIKSTKKEIQEKDRIIELIRKSKKTI